MLVFLKLILLDFIMYIFIVTTYIYKNPNFCVWASWANR